MHAKALDVSLYYDEPADGSPPPRDKPPEHADNAPPPEVPPEGPKTIEEMPEPTETAVQVQQPQLWAAGRGSV